jgi:nucleoid-associated protein EbfC
MARNGFPGAMGGGNMQQLMRQAQKMQQDMTRIQQEIGEREFTASVGGGVVSATVLGTKELKSVTIDPSCVDPDDVEMLQDLIISAVNEAMRNAEETMNTEMNKVTGGMKLGF